MKRTTPFSQGRKNTPARDKRGDGKKIVPTVLWRTVFRPLKQKNDRKENARKQLSRLFPNDQG
jgi:hypothetical protein